MPTLRGWLVVSIGAVILAIGRVLGSIAVMQVGVALIALVAIAMAVIKLGRHELEVTRTASPPRVAAGHPVTVTVEVANRGRGAAPLLLLEDRVPVELSGRGRFAIQGIEPGGTRSDSYEVRPSRRGRYEIGPMTISYVDPFGLASRSAEAASTAAFLVRPRVETLALPRDLGERRSLAVSALRQPTGSSGEDFYTLREYVEGDDLKRIHWPSTAKRNRYMIRQEETPWHTRATVVFDDSAAHHGGYGEGSSFERTVEAAASLADLYHRTGYSYRLAGAHNPGLPSARGADHVQRCMDLLATIDTTPAARPDDAVLARLAEIEGGTSAEGALIFVGGSLRGEVAIALTRCRRRFKQVVAVSFPAHRFGSEATKQRWAGEQQTVEVARLLARSGVRTVVLGPGESFASGWATLSHVRQGGGEDSWGRKPELV
ncbi:MAG TPA: DUF58 domain-containing protein [Actinomycetota bacterium]